MRYENIRRMLLDGRLTEVLIASHRGKFGSSVMENTVLAFQTAIGQGADLVEMDLERTKDGRFIGHHDDDMKRLFRKTDRIEDYTYTEITEMPIYNNIGEICAEGVSTLEEILEALKGKTILVLDKCWDHWEEISDIILKYGMADQIILKYYMEDEKAVSWSYLHPEFMYIPMVANPDDIDRVIEMKSKTTVVGMEILPEKPDDRFLDTEYISQLHEHGLAVWCNSLSLAKRLVYGGGFDDLRSMRYGGDSGWGELVKRGVDIIQTDWVYEVKTYLLGRKKA